jgi:Zn-dependent peptidase ImmA (M78 family)
VDLPEHVSGLTMSDPAVGFFVVANRAHHHLRRRFSFAHEYAHVVLDRGRFGLVSRASQRGDLLEVRANAFAAGFLMPEEGVLEFMAGIGKGDPSGSLAELFANDEPIDAGLVGPGGHAIQLYDIVQLAHHFGVSRSAAIYRLRNLRILDSRQVTALKAQDEVGKGKNMADLLGFPEPDHTAARNEFRHRFVCLALEAYRRGEISHAKLRELGTMVAMSAEDLESLIELSEVESHGADAPTTEGGT